MRRGIGIAGACAATVFAWTGHATASMTSNPYWHWETVTINPGESYHFHYEDLQLQGQWTSLWIEWATAGTAHVQLDMHGQFHLDPGDSIHAHVHASNPFVDWEMFTNIGDEPQSLHGGIQVGGQPEDDAWIGPVLPGETGSVHVEVNDPIPGSASYELAKWFVNESMMTQWWAYWSTTTTWVDFVETDSLHLHSHFEELLFEGAWLWIENDGDDPITFVLHFHVPSPGGLALLAIAAPLAVVRRRR